MKWGAAPRISSLAGWVERAVDCAPEALDSVRDSAHVRVRLHEPSELLTRRPGRIGVRSAAASGRPTREEEVA